MIQRSYIPGSPWLYFKIYTGHKTADDILVGRMRPIIDKLLRQEDIDKFFFIRYDDPDFHLRFRVHISGSQSYAAVFNQFYSAMQPCIDNGQVAKILCDTYYREIERYGDKTMELLEELFWIDSLAIILLLSTISTVSTDDKEQIRWKLSLNLLDDTLSAFGLDLKERHDLMERMSENFKREFGFINHTFTKQLNDKYRMFRNTIKTCISDPQYDHAVKDVLSDRKRKMSEVAERIRAVLPTNSMGPNLDELLSSIQHMTMNRWFRSKNRKHELVIYDFLSRDYESNVARSQNTNQEVPENL